VRVHALQSRDTHTEVFVCYSVQPAVHTLPCEPARWPRCRMMAIVAGGVRLQAAGTNLMDPGRPGLDVLNAGRAERRGRAERVEHVQ